MKKLIVSADDFGLARTIDEGIVKACSDGIVTFINVLPGGPSFEEDLYLLNGLKLKEIGAHLALSGMRPVTDGARIPTLVTKDGSFRRNYIHFFLDLFLNRINRDEIYRELRNQLERLKKTGIPITCLTSHEHIHMMPSILHIFIRLAKEYDIPFIRYPHKDLPVEPVSAKKLIKLFIMSVFEKRMGVILRESALRYTDHFAGLIDSGNLTEGSILKMLKKVEDGTTELVCHPGFLGPEIIDRCIFHLNCEGELSALTSKRVKKALQDNGIGLSGYAGIIT